LEGHILACFLTLRPPLLASCFLPQALFELPPKDFSTWCPYFVDRFANPREDDILRSVTPPGMEVSKGAHATCFKVHICHPSLSAIFPCDPCKDDILRGVTPPGMEVSKGAIQSCLVSLLIILSSNPHKDDVLGNVTPPGMEVSKGAYITIYLVVTPQCRALLVTH